jgi:hypothetical protein
MAFDANLAERIRARLKTQAGVTEKKMFGGLSFLMNGNMCCGVHGDEMIARLAQDDGERALSEPHTRRFDLTGRPMKGWILVGPAGLAADADLGRWVDRAAGYAASLPPK